MKKKIMFFLAGILAVSLGFTVYVSKNFLKERKEFTTLFFAYEARTNYEAGSQAYPKALPALKEKRYEALYNLANLSFREALRKENVSLLVSAAEYYKEALRMKPDFLLAKRNLELAEGLIEALRSAEKEKNADAAGKGKKAEEKEKKDEGKLLPGTEPYEPHLP